MKHATVSNRFHNTGSSMKKRYEQHETGIVEGLALLSII